MTKRERDIFKIIESDPFISQNEIADKLDITRSAVSAYLNTMYKKGIIKGRGYIISEETYPLLVGPSHIDIRSICDRPLSTGVYNSVKTQIIHGGPTKNAAEHLIGLELFPRAIFAIAGDSFGASFLQSCEQAGINVDGSLLVNNAISPVYTEIVDADLRLITASFSTHNLSSYITPEHLQAQSNLLKNASTIVLHDSVPPESAEYLVCYKAKADLVLVSSDYEYTEPMLDLFHIYDTAILPYYIASNIADTAEVGKPAQYVPVETVSTVVQKMAQYGLKDFFMFIDGIRLCHFDGKRLTIHTSLNPASKKETVYRTYMKCRDVFAAVITYARESGLAAVEVLDYLAAARNIVCSSDSYFSGGVSLAMLQDEILNLSPERKSLGIKYPPRREEARLAN